MSRHATDGAASKGGLRAWLANIRSRRTVLRSAAGPKSRETTGLVPRSIARIVLGAFFVAQTPTGFAQTAAPMPDAGAESPEVAEAFSHLDALAEELAERRNLLAHANGGTPLPAPSPPIPAPAPAPSNGGPRPAPSLPGTVPVPSEPGRCGPLEEIAETIKEARERYGEYSSAIAEVNGKLPDFREGVLDPERVCERRFGDDIGYAIRRIKELDILVDQQHVGGLSVCVDSLRRETDDKMSEEISTIRLQRLAAQLDRLRDTNEQTMSLERSLVRGISKRDRLVQELEHFHEEIKRACQ